ncbi:YHS domain-containing (seleno)protein [Pseudahrensia aquimaris]|uniref:YHS domain-containing (Seleno)protein n=1 Tax=Pseudahrensia aquimaris TaxID=744461 RepID=A0ABW3FLA8_9HYPH
MNRRAFVFTLALSAAALAMTTLNSAQARAFTGTTKGVAINGYDPVAYFTEGKPVKGNASFSADWEGVKLHFASAANRDTFLSNPTKYAPKYGGHCAFAAAKGYIAKTVPEAFSIVDGRLYLNFSLGVKKQWDGNRTEFIKSADKNWPEIK